MSIVKVGSMIIYYRDKNHSIYLPLVYTPAVYEWLYWLEKRHPGAGASYVECALNAGNFKLYKRTRQGWRKWWKRITCNRKEPRFYGSTTSWSIIDEGGNGK